MVLTRGAGQEAAVAKDVADAAGTNATVWLRHLIHGITTCVGYILAPKRNQLCQVMCKRQKKHCT